MIRHTSLKRSFNLKNLLARTVLMKCTTSYKKFKNNSSKNNNLTENFTNKIKNLRLQL